MFSAQILFFLPISILSSATVTGAQEVITASTGDTVQLNCPSSFTYNDRVYVTWKKDETIICTYYLEKNKTTNHTYNSQTQLTFKVNPNSNALSITDITRSDAGVYNCSLLRVIPPPSVEDLSVLNLQVNAPPALVVQQMNSSNVTCVDLLCSLEGLSPEGVNFTWTRGSEQLLHHNSPTSMSSVLKLCKPDWRDRDTITCHASYSSKHNTYSTSYTLKESRGDLRIPWKVTGSVVCACVGLIVIILISVALYKRKKKISSNGSTVYTNKVYENFRYLTPSAEPSLGPHTPTNPSPRSQTRTTLGPRPHTQTTPSPRSQTRTTLGPTSHTSCSLSLRLHTPTTLIPRSHTLTTPRPTPQGASQTMKEECIYEN